MIDEKWDRALKNFEFVIDAHYENPFAFFYSAKCLEKLGDQKKALEYYKKCKSIIETNVGYRKLWDRFVKEGISFVPILEDTI